MPSMLLSPKEISCHSIIMQGTAVTSVRDEQDVIPATKDTLLHHQLHKYQHCYNKPSINSKMLRLTGHLWKAGIYQ